MYVRDQEGVYFVHPKLYDSWPVVPKLPAGAYRAEAQRPGGLVSFSSNGEPVPYMAFVPLALNDRPVYPLNTVEMYAVQREVRAFFNKRITQRLTRAGLKHRRGIILYGPPGTGKTSIVRQLIPFLIEQDAVIIVDDCFSAYALTSMVIPAIRENDPERPIVLVYDDLFRINQPATRDELLRMLDGMDSPDHLLTIICTDEFLAVYDHLRHRPSCFGMVWYLARMPEGVHARLAEQKYPMLSEADRQFAVQLTRHLPIDYLEEACTLFLMGYSPDEVSERMQTIMPSD
jgi:hypothetical protein